MSENIILEVAEQARLVRTLQKRYFKEHKQSTFKECLFQEHELDRLINLWDSEITMMKSHTNVTQPALNLPEPKPLMDKLRPDHPLAIPISYPVQAEG